MKCVHARAADWDVVALCDMLGRGMADSERVDRRFEQLAGCCYGLACIDALARRKRLLVTAIRVPGVVVSARVVASWGVALGNAATTRPDARPSSFCRWHNLNVNTNIPLGEIVWRHQCDLFVLQPPALRLLPTSIPWRLRGARLLPHCISKHTAIYAV
jgi:hypothetical protein